ncbi:OsmC family protein [Alicyclobacillus sp. SO9]|uniref:OsmC family protein n=1 Tax=Alicyclobacillus sp. SO9 TaxID=2665646 RepID=UPI0018E889B9|nr:OsmC family protein [Alicyclobacillus sp. SO9]QQE80115.1 OsmC family protein [Alicyclobacillus sp. SO9]
MAELNFSITAEWSGTGRDGEGVIDTGGQTIHYAAPDNMGGKGTGTSPEELLLSAVASCYSSTLFALLKKTGMPVEKITIQTEGIVTDYPLKTKFSTLRVHPTVHGGVEALSQRYQEAALTARDKCFIGKSIHGNISYEVGHVLVKPAVQS